MCDLLTVSSHYAYRARFSLPDFAVCGERNCHGWGVGYFKKTGEPAIEKSSLMAYDNLQDSIDKKLLDLAARERSEYFIGHVRLTSCGATCDQNCHPFQLPFLGTTWLFAHNGTCKRIMDYETEKARIPEATNDSARIFEYLRDRIDEQTESATGMSQSLFRLVRNATLMLFNEYDARNETFNFLLCNGHVLFVFMHHRPFYMLCRKKTASNALIITTCGDEDGGGLTDGEEWVRVNDEDRSYGSLHMISGDTVLHSEEIHRGE
ncbi:MAG: class II glutamine amidotransferase [Verrucomicrobia bacterium]|nr:class II glutamine amidotransferase [Verrucomicrobiota bacterium]MCH8510974.1 class II glutamine amidotransferase [Kiritimatiellia bacterium]